MLKRNLAIAAVDGASIRLDAALHHDFAGAAPRLYRWRPMSGFGMEHLTVEKIASLGIGTWSQRSISARERLSRPITRPQGWDDFPFAAFCGHDHRMTADTAQPG